MQWRNGRVRAPMAALASAMALTVLVACDAAETTRPQQEPKPVATVAVTAPRLTMLVGEQMTLVATPKAVDGEVLQRPVAWNTGDVALATVSAEGIVTAVAQGPVTITAQSGGRAGSVLITLVEPEQPAVTEVTLTAATTTIEVGETIFVGVRLKLASGQIVERPVVWTSNAPLVASATAPELSFGVIEARGAGVATITAAVGAAQASVTFSIAPRPTHDLLYSVIDGAQSSLYVLGIAQPSAPARVSAGSTAWNPSPSPDGTRIVFAVPQLPDLPRPQQDLYIMNRDGSGLRQLTQMTGIAADPMWSPDGTRIVFQGINASFEESNIWVVNVDGTGLTNLTGAIEPGVSNKRHPAWSPDGSRIAFIAARDGLHKVWTMIADGTNAAPLMADNGFDQSPTWSPAGDKIAFTRYNTDVRSNGWDVMIVSSAGGVPTRLALPGDQLVPTWSPDGHYIAISGTREAGQGMQNLYTMRPDGTALRLRTVEPAWGGGYSPAWIVRR